MKKTKITKAVIPAAGYGTRFLPASKAIPKEMFPIIDVPTIQFIIEEAVASGITDLLIIISSNNNKNVIMDHFDYCYELEQKLKEKNKSKELACVKHPADLLNIHYVRQKETLGLGHAILMAETFANNEPFAVLLGDDVVFSEKGEDPALLQCIKAYEQTNSSIVGVQSVSKSNVSKYGIVDPADKETTKNELIKLKGMVEKPTPKEAPSDLAILGRYVLTPSIFKELKNTKKDIRNEIELTDALMLLSSKEDIYAQIFKGKRFDIGSKLGYVQSILYRATRDEEIADEVMKYINSQGYMK